MSQESAKEFIKQAENALNPKGFFAFIGVESSDYTLAAELYSKAANHYKVLKDYPLATKYFNKASKIYRNNDITDFRLISCLINCAECSTNYDIKLAITYYIESINLSITNGRLNDSGKHSKRLAEIYELNTDYINAIKQYQQAAEYYKSNNPTSYEIYSCISNAALLCVKNTDYQLAVELFENLANLYASSEFQKHKYMNCCVNAMICRLIIGDIVACKKSIDVYITLKSDFIKSQEYKFIDSLIYYYEHYDYENFRYTILDYDKQITSKDISDLLTTISDKLIQSEGDNLC